MISHKLAETHRGETNADIHVGLLNADYAVIAYSLSSDLRTGAEPFHMLPVGYFFDLLHLCLIDHFYTV